MTPGSNFPVTRRSNFVSEMESKTMLADLKVMMVKIEDLDGELEDH
jgi:hypothetical protein